MVFHISHIILDYRVFVFVWHTFLSITPQGPSMLSQMVGFPSFEWLKHIFCHITFSVSVQLQWILRLLPCLVLSCFSHDQLCVILWTVACQAPLYMGFSRQKYWSGLPCPHPGDLLNPGIEPSLPHSRQILYHLSHQY